jgi:HAD superfamily hydrolase (TIGR01456 family)
LSTNLTESPRYGFQTVVTPGDILTAHPEVWPFSQQFLPFYGPISRPLPTPIHATDPTKSLRIDAVFVYNDPRDWGLDITILKDLLLSHAGILGTLSPKNNNPALPNRGFQQDNQPPVFFSNPDLVWAAKYHLPRLGQGGFREAFEGVWAAITGGPRAGVEFQKTVIGKPFRQMYEFAEKRLVGHRKDLVGETKVGALRKVYMVGDNPESDIRGGNTYQSPLGTEWASILVRTGVHVEGQTPAYRPSMEVDDVWDAVKWAIEDSNWDGGVEKE